MVLGVINTGLIIIPFDVIMRDSRFNSVSFYFNDNLIDSIKFENHDSCSKFYKELWRSVSTNKGNCCIDVKNVNLSTGEWKVW